jgi:hypothetical protein
MIYVFHRKSYGIPPICLTFSQRVIIISKLQIRIKEIGQSETRIVCDDHVCQRIGMTCAILIEDLPKTVRNINRTRFLNLIRIWSFEIIITLWLNVRQIGGTILVSDWPISNNLLLWNCLAKWAELWFEAPIGGSVCIKFPQSRMKGERHRLSTESLFSVSKARTFVVLQLVANVALIEYT